MNQARTNSPSFRFIFFKKLYCSTGRYDPVTNVIIASLLVDVVLGALGLAAYYGRKRGNN